MCFIDPHPKVKESAKAALVDISSGKQSECIIIVLSTINITVASSLSLLLLSSHSLLL